MWLLYAGEVMLLMPVDATVIVETSVAGRRRRERVNYLSHFELLLLTY